MIVDTVITKTLFVQSSCPKRLWLTRNKPEAVTNKDTQQTVEGREVGVLAREYFCSAYNLIEAPTKRDMASKTRQALLAPAGTVVCEAAFFSEDLYAAADIVIIGEKGLDIYEVKATTSIKSIQLEDVAFQCHVIEKAGYHVNSVHIMHLNNDYRLEGSLDVQKLFVLSDVTFNVHRMQEGIAEKINGCRDILAMNEEPDRSLSLQCEKPYLCACRDYCFAMHHVPSVSIFDVAGMTAQKKYALWNSGCRTPEEMLNRRNIFTERQSRQIQSMQSSDRDELHVETAQLKKFLDSLRYPLYLLDFETFQCAIPRFQGVAPYEQIPFQYSLHWIEGKGGELRHAEFLAKEGVDPRLPLAAALSKDISREGMVMAYNNRFEKSVMAKLSQQFPELAPVLEAICDSMADLMLPFQKRWVYCDAMHGSFSIKAVLPALCGGDPELDYHRLPLIHNGAEAMSAFSTLHLTDDPVEVQRTRQALLNYCRLDTLAMAKILEKLYTLVE